MQAGLELEGGFFTGPASNRFWLRQLNDDGTIEIAFAYHLGDEAVLRVEQMTSSTAC